MEVLLICRAWFVAKELQVNGCLNLLDINTYHTYAKKYNVIHLKTANNHLFRTSDMMSAVCIIWIICWVEKERELKAPNCKENVLHSPKRHFEHVKELKFSSFFPYFAFLGYHLYCGSRAVIPEEISSCLNIEKSSNLKAKHSNGFREKAQAAIDRD